jgi:hypothetical protein
LRRPAKRLALTAVFALGLPVSWLVASNVFLNTPLASRSFSRSDRFRIEWGRAWMVVPGRIATRDLHLEGRSRGVAWSIDAEQATGRIALGTLTERTFRLTELRAAGVRAAVARPPAAAAPLPPGKRRPGAKPPWRFELPDVVLDPLREVDLHGWRIGGVGRAEGSLWFVPGGEVHLGPTTLRLADGTVVRGETPVATAVELSAEATLGPYRPREAPGVAGLEHLGGSLRATGEVPPGALPAAAAAAVDGRPGHLVVDLRVASGRLGTGSRVELMAGQPLARRAPGAPAPSAPAPNANERSAVDANPSAAAAAVAAAAAGPGIDLLATVEEANGVPQLQVRFAGRDVAGGGPPAGPELFRAATVEATAATPELALHHLFDSGRELRAGRAPGGRRLDAALRAETLQIAAPGARATLRATIDHVTARLELTALLGRHLAIEGLRAEGADLELQLGREAAPGKSQGRAPWSLAVKDAELTGLRELSVDDLVVRGDSRVGATLSYARDGTFTVEGFTVAMPAGTLLSGGAAIADGLALEVDASLAPTVLGAIHGRALLRRASGTATLRGTAPSVAFVNPYLAKTPWLALAGSGSLDARLTLAEGVLMPGTRLTVGAAPALVTLFESRAEGRGTITVAVEESGNGARTELRVGLERFSLGALPPSRKAAYLRGRGLRLVAATPVAIDLGGAIPEVDATLEIPDAEVPDLRVYDALLPASAGVSLLSGSGRVTLRLQASSATRRATGTATLTSQAARLRFQNVELAGRVKLRAPLVSPDLMTRRFDLAGTEIDLDEVTYRDLEGAQPSQAGWWLHSRLASGSLEWGSPVKLTGEGTVDMQSTCPLLALFAGKSRMVRWLDDVLRVENVAARGSIRLAGDLFEVRSLQATGGSLELRSRMRFSGASKRGHLYLRYGRLATGIELRDKEREYHLLRPLEWYEGAAAEWPASP